MCGLVKKKVIFAVVIILILSLVGDTVYYINDYYKAENSTDFDGIILLASYSTADLSGSELDVLSIYGSNDGVLNMEKYEECKQNLPENFKEFVITGGCHAYFGAYGEKAGDKKVTITRDEQIEITVDEIMNFIK